MKAHFDIGSLKEESRSIIINDANVIPQVQGHPNIVQAKEVFSKGRIMRMDLPSEAQHVFSVMVLETLRGGELNYHIKKCG